MNVCTVILGAGKGSRMKSITPKPFHKVANLKLIDWVLNTLNSIKIDKKIIVTSKDINYSEYSKTNRIVIQNDQLGTGNAVIETKNELKNFNDKTGEYPKELLQNIPRIIYTNNINDLNECEVFIITVPTPIDDSKKPDLSFLRF